MSRAERLFNKWNQDGEIWKPYIVELHSKEEIENMNIKELRVLKTNIDNWKRCLKATNNKGINLDYMAKYDYSVRDGTKMEAKGLKEELEKLEEQFYYYIINNDIEFKNSNKTISDVPSHFTYDRGEQTTFFKIFSGAERLLLRQYHKECLEVIRQLITICADLNLAELLEAKEAEQEIVNALPNAEKNKHYEKKRRVKNPEKEQERKENGLLRLKEWKEENPEKWAESHKQSVKKYNEKAKDLSICKTDEELAAKVVKIAIDTALKRVYNQERYKLKKQLKEQPN